jgi:hypothetical protein
LRDENRPLGVSCRHAQGVASGPDLTQTKALQRAVADEARRGRLTREERRWIDANPERAARGL